MKQINIFEKAGAFAENKDVARDLRLTEIIPALENNESVVIDFDKVTAATQSFIHALVSDILRKYGSDVLDKISFKSCSENIKKIINIVVDYMQDGMMDESR